MLTEVLDSNPGANICFPSHIQFNCTPAYKGKVKGQPLLGHGRRKYTHFIPMRGAADHVKDLLEIPDTHSTLHPPVEAAKELLKEEKIVKGEDQKLMTQLIWLAQSSKKTPKNTWKIKMLSKKRVIQQTNMPL